MKFFQNKRNVFLSLFIGVLLVWGLSYTNCGTELETTPGENLSTQTSGSDQLQRTTSQSASAPPMYRIQKNKNDCGYTLVAEPGFSWIRDKANPNQITLVDNKQKPKIIAACFGTCFMSDTIGDPTNPKCKILDVDATTESHFANCGCENQSLPNSCQFTITIK